MIPGRNPIIDRHCSGIVGNPTAQLIPRITTGRVEKPTIAVQAVARGGVAAAAVAVAVGGLRGTLDSRTLQSPHPIEAARSRKQHGIE